MAKSWVGEPATFIKEDIQEVQSPRNDAVFVSLNIKNYDVHLIFIDNKSSANIQYFDAFVKMGVSPNQLGKMGSPLVSSTRDAILMEGVITLPVKMG